MKMVKHICMLHTRIFENNQNLYLFYFWLSRFNLCFFSNSNQKGSDFIGVGVRQKRGSWREIKNAVMPSSMTNAWIKKTVVIQEKLHNLPFVLF